MGTLGWILVLLLAIVALIAPVVASEHARARAAEDTRPDRDPDEGGTIDPDTPAPPLSAPPIGPPDQTTDREI